MDTSEIRKAKTEMERKILQAINEFENKTHLSVTDIGRSTVQKGAGQQITNNVHTRIELTD